MGKTSICIQMLQLLNSGRIYKISELAELLETNPRNIVEYKKELEEAGYYIDSIPGKYGGYKLGKRCLIPSLSLLPEEKKVIDLTNNYLLNRNDFLNKKEYLLAISKILSSISNNENQDNFTIINRFPLSMCEADLKDRFNFLQDNIAKKRTVKFNYISLKNVEKEYLFDPYELFMFNNAWFVIGWHHKKNSIAYFKINRITSFASTNQEFKIWSLYNKNDYLSDYGFKNNGDWYHIEFKATGNYAALVKERVYGKNQEVISIDENTTLVKVDMQNKENILVFILGFNKNIEVLKPDWLKEELVNFSKFLYDLYKKSNL